MHQIIMINYYVNNIHIYYKFTQPFKTLPNLSISTAAFRHSQLLMKKSWFCSGFYIRKASLSTKIQIKPGAKECRVFTAFNEDETQGWY
jgi:hypothetical protein